MEVEKQIIEEETAAAATSTAASSVNGSSEVNRAVTWEGCSVLLDINDGDRLVFSRLSPAATIKIGNNKCSLGPLVGCPFGSLFTVEAGAGGLHLSRSAASPTGNCVEHSKDEAQSVGEIRDNRELVDNNTAQSLSSEDIEALRSEGATGDDIVKALIANSSTFEKKTVFSQEKYKLKKQKKYAPKVLLRRPSMRSICETYFKKHPQRTGFMRVDTLSMLLSLANVGPNSDALVLDKLGGLVVGSVAERVGGTGYICSTYFGAVPYQIDIVRMFNFSKDVCARILQAPFCDLSSMQNPPSESAMPDPSDMGPSSAETAQPDPSNEILNQDDSSLLDSRDSRDNDDDALTGQKSVKPGRKAPPEIIKSWKDNGFTSLIVAAPDMDVESLIMDLLPLLAYSAPFAIYHQYLQPLATCMHKLQASKMAIGLQISEPWLREYQVLPSRTHPHMQMNAFGGYILSGIRISNTGGANEDKTT
ncbi:tRNA (adenine(58)-N(1))-methyltransferase non-catalytic subunit trm6 isoform X2 [Carex littledalei]|uniref:tRNA (adenine(58)-N(1))-methyltransferase non-catalytic subunit TRM6 n=1 Tax=Carex littledalei TaxID=544730 RepID=A0A833QQQ4_9POAL|nr:tRNA (adenine(58)-N(1))-methyltransferase non-catalytic subunit trm6 isoform X2 [Carex littledalei]